MFRIVVILLWLVSANSGTETPIIGILSQKTYIVAGLFPGQHYGSFISAGYVKHMESAGARVIPIWIGQSEEYYRRVVKYTNGIVFPGGGTYFNETKGYGEAARQIYQIALEANKNGIYYPIWGICLGLQVLPFAATGKDIRVHCDLQNAAIPLNFTKASRKSRLFSKTPKFILNSLSFHNVTLQNHHFCLTQRVLKEHGLLSDWKILATNEDHNVLQFISVMEHTDYPVYGVQFHPEKIAFEFKDKEIPHTREAVVANEYFAGFFVDEAKKNNNSFPTKELEKKSLIYNYNPKYTGLNEKSSYEQIYIFNKTDSDAAQLL